MTKLIVIFLLCTGCCFSQTTTKDSTAHSSINVTDNAKKKQGYWIITGKMKPQQSIYLPDQVIEKGHYKDNRKTGMWKEYYPNGIQKNEILFENGYPKGYAIMYHDNGQKSEEGTWENNRWEGTYTSYDKNGTIIEQKVFTYK